MSALSIRRKRHRLVLALVSLVLAAAALAGVAVVRVQGKATPHTDAAASAAVLELAPAELYTVRRETLSEHVPLAGALRPVDQAVVKPTVTARVREVTVREGDRVEKGHVLVRLDTADLQARLNEKLSNLESSRAQLVLAEKTRANNAALRERGIVSQTAMDQAESSFRVNQAAVAALEAQVAVARKALADATIVSPVAGFIAERAINPGETAVTDAKVFSIVDLSRMEVEALVPASDIPRVQVGQKVNLRVEGFGDRRFKARVVRINPTTQANSRSISVFVVLDNDAERSLKGGMFASGNIVVAQREDGLAVPAEAVRQDGDGAFVLTVEQNRIARRPVTLGPIRTPEGFVEIAEGLSGGETVVAAPLTLAPDLPVRIAGTH
jgi:RND family efflux transporter MFP subunit